jgi:hypothetical protein
MDEQIQKRLDGIVEDDIRRGYRNKTIPADLLASLEESQSLDATSPVFRRVRFTKLTAKKKRLINEEVIKRYHADLKNPHLLSTEQLKKLNMERGEWTKEMEARKQELTETTNRMMKELYSEGFDQREEWLTRKETAYLLARRAIDRGLDDHGKEVATTEAERTELLTLLDRWARWNPDVQADYTSQYSEGQGLSYYSPDRDAHKLLDKMPTLEGIEALNELDDYRDKIWRYIECVKLRHELLDLQVKEAKMLADSVEQRRDTTEEMARLYFCCDVLGEHDIAQGPLTKTYDALWDLPDDVLQWLLIQIYFFFQGTPDVDDAEEFLQQWGFIPAPQATTSDNSSGPSDASLAEPNSSTDLPPSPATPVASSPSRTPTS